MPILKITEPIPGYQHVTIANPPLNLFNPDMVTELTTWETDDSLAGLIYAAAPGAPHSVRPTAAPHPGGHR